MLSLPAAPQAGLKASLAELELMGVRAGFCELGYLRLELTGFLLDCFHLRLLRECQGEFPALLECLNFCVSCCHRFGQLVYVLVWH